MKSENFKRLKTLIEALTHSGSSTLDEDIFKEVKKICKSSQSNIPQVYDLVLAQLKKNNSQVRLSAFQICEELFKRSAIFRESVLKDLHLIFELTAEINSSKKLPPPKLAAESVKTLAISTLKKWVEEFGETYKKLKIAHNYFKKCQGADFETLQIHNSAQVAENEQQRHIRAVNEEKIKKVLDEFESIESDIEMIITSLFNCLSLLLPPVEEFFIPEHDLQEINFQNDNGFFNVSSINLDGTCSSNTNKDNSTGDNDGYFLENSNNPREFGVPLDYKLILQLNIGEKFKVAKTDENSSVIENAKDCVRLINNRYLPMLKKFIIIYCKCSNGSISGVKKIMDLKEKLENALKKYNSIIIEDESVVLNDEDSSDDEFEEVTKEGYEEFVDFSEDLLLERLQKKIEFKTSNSEREIFQSSSKETLCSASTSSAKTPEALECSSVQQLDRKKKLMAIAPKLPYDIDLYHWEDEKLSTPTLISTRIDGDKFWGSSGDDIHEIPDPGGVAALRTRIIEYTGTFEPVKWTCRAPLPSGKLCPRRDRYKCPFHGKVVARDEMGNIQNKEDEKASNQKAKKSSAIAFDFQDPEFLSDLQAATGLRIPDRKGEKGNLKQKNLTYKKLKVSSEALKIMEAKRLPGLVDVVKRQNNAYARLRKKIFNRSSLRRVSSALNKLDKKKFVDKYGDQFNYV